MHIKKRENADANVITKKHRRREIVEKIKTAAIWLLCISTVYLTYKTIDMQGNSGSIFYNNANPARVLTPELTTENILESYLDYSEPELIIINKGDKRGALRPENAEYDKTMDFINKIMQSLHSDAVKYSKVSRDAVLKNLMIANSIYIKYPYPRLTDMDAQFYQVRDSAFAKNASLYSQAFLLPDTTGGKVIVYVASAEDLNEMLRVETESFAATLLEIIDSIDYITQKEYAYAAELNLDKTDGATNGGRLVLDSMLTIPLNNTITKTVVAELPWEYKNTLNFTQTTDYSVGLMEIFNYNPNTIRQYVDKNGTLTFVSEKGTLSMEQDGVLKYKALDQSAGVSFSSGDNGSGNLYASAAGTLKTVKRINGLCYTDGSENKTEIKFTEIIKSTENDIYFKLDYFVNGHKVDMNGGSAIEVRVHGGIMTELKMHIKTFNVLGKSFENKALISAIDEIYAESGTRRHVESAELVYKYSGIGVDMNTEWEISTGKKE